jgi:hypothetical protein
MRLHRLLLASLAVLAVASVAAVAGDGPVPVDLPALRRMSTDQLIELYRAAEVGRPLDGKLRGRIVHVEDRFLPGVKRLAANTLWRGKVARAQDGYFINRWLGGIRAIESTYTIGPSWIDGKPALLMDYPQGTPLFGNVHDEVREVAPGLYLGPVFEKCPCPRLRGFIVLTASCGCR